jgi:hypothetical protein
LRIFYFARSAPIADCTDLVVKFLAMRRAIEAEWIRLRSADRSCQSPARDKAHRGQYDWMLNTKRFLRLVEIAMLLIRFSEFHVGALSQPRHLVEPSALTDRQTG